MSEFRTMSLPSVMLFVSMKMSSGVAAAAAGVTERQRPLHCAASLGRPADGSPLLCHANGGRLKGLWGGPLVKKACGLRCRPGWPRR